MKYTLYLTYIFVQRKIALNRDQLTPFSDILELPRPPDTHSSTTMKRKMLTFFYSSKT